MRRADAPGLLHDLTPDERFGELACLLAMGLRALRDKAVAPPDPGTSPADEPPPESGPNCLEVSPETRLSVHTG